jgi:hypothetical protein
MPAGEINFSDTDPAPPAGKANIKWQKSAVTGVDPITGYPVNDVSGYIDNPSAVGSIGLVIDGGGSVPALGQKGFIQIPFACTITGWTMIADVSGSAQITVSKGTYASFPTLTSIVASLPPVLTSTQKNTSTTLTGWTTSVVAGDIIGFNLDSVATLTRVILQLQILR